MKFMKDVIYKVNKLFLLLSLEVLLEYRYNCFKCVIFLNKFIIEIVILKIFLLIIFFIFVDLF